MSADLPPEPERRSIAPAPEDYENAPGTAAVMWPFLWIGIAVVLWATLG